MQPFQGNEPARLSALLLEILDRMQQKHGGAGIHQLASGAAELSRIFTRRRDALGKDYLSDPALAAAYLTYFFPVNLSKIQVLLDELPEDWYVSGSGQPLRVLDLGAGPGTGPLAVLDWLNQHDREALKKLTVVAVDRSPQALRQARDLWNAYSRQIGTSEEGLTLCEGDLARATCNGWNRRMAEQAPYDLILVANCLNELFDQTQQSIEERSSLIADLLTRLTPHGTVMLVEPALRETTRALHQVRDRLLAENRCTVYSPCLHEKNCPALLNPDDWCHEERPWEPPSWIQQIDRKVGFVKDALKFSYLLLRTDGRTIAQRGPQTFRMVSELRKLKGDTRAWLCNELGRSEVGRLDRAQSDSNLPWDQCQRGTIVHIEGMKRKEGSALGRIPAEAMVEIVRAV
jgi:ribosomal protein RSM22 (predicted rRNA methylase)